MTYIFSKNSSLYKKSSTQHKIHMTSKFNSVALFVIFLHKNNFSYRTFRYSHDPSSHQISHALTIVVHY